MATMGNKPWDNLTHPYEPPKWSSKPQYHLPRWAEPVTIVVILFTTMFVTRRRDFRILGGGNPGPYRSALDVTADEARSTDELLAYERNNDDDRQSIYAQEKMVSKTRTCCGVLQVHTPNSSRFKNHLHSRILQKFPFLVEMFYWAITFIAYRSAHMFAKERFKGHEIWNAAEAHALDILNFEYEWLTYLLPWDERAIQQWFMKGHQDMLTFLNRSYSLIHIPGTIGFIGWYYYTARSHTTFALVRRTLTLTNYLAFICFIFYPVMPPRLLPKEYGFLDTVHQADATSVWMSGRYVNALAAMPSMHFGYAVTIGCASIYHSGIFRTRFEKGEMRKNVLWKIIYVFIGLAYPSYILITILATANHYWLDAIVAFGCVFLAFLCNRIFLVLMPVEDCLLWVLRLEKPIPSTGERFHARGGRL